MTQVHPDLAPTEAWTYAVNGTAYRGTAASPPIVVNEGDKVEITFVNGGSKEMAVNMPHSIDFHSAEVAPNKNYIDIGPGKELKIKFTADHPGVFMYHCATQPILLHTSAGMMGMMVVKPRNLAPVDRELWMTQEEFYLGKPGKPADMAKMAAGTADVVRLQRLREPVQGRIRSRSARGEKIRMYVLDAGPSKWSAFHVIGTVFDRTVVEGTVGRDSQTINLAPSQGGWVEFTLDAGGQLPVRHPRVRRHGQGRRGHPAHDRRAEGRRRRRARRARRRGREGRRQRDARRHVGQGRQDDGQGRQGHVRGHQHRRHHARPGDRPGAGQGRRAGCSTRAPSWPRARTSRPAPPARVTADLKPGKYELVCYLPGHYMAGQKLPFEVR